MAIMESPRANLIVFRNIILAQTLQFGIEKATLSIGVYPRRLQKPLPVHLSIIVTQAIG